MYFMGSIIAKSDFDYTKYVDLGKDTGTNCRIAP